MKTNIFPAAMGCLLFFLLGGASHAQQPAKKYDVNAIEMRLSHLRVERDALANSNADKRYFLQKLSNMNNVIERLEAQLSKLQSSTPPPPAKPIDLSTIPGDGQSLITSKKIRILLHYPT